MPLWALILHALEGHQILSVVISFIIMWVLVVIIGRFNTSLFFIARRTYFPALIFIILYSIFPGQMILNPALPAAILIILALWRMIISYRKNGVAYNFFDAAMIISVAGLIYANALWFFILVIIGTLILRTPDIKEIVAAFFGAILPWAVLFAYWYLTGKDPARLADIIYSNLFEEAPSVYWSRTLIILLIAIAINFIPGFYKLMTEMATQKIKTQKSFSMLIWMLIISLGALLLVPSASVEMTAIAAIPVSYIMANYYVFTRRTTTAEILLLATLLMLIVSRIWPY